MIDNRNNPTLAIWLEDAWLQRYLDRGLGDDEEAWFEAYMLDKPRLLEQVEADTMLRDGMHAWHAEQQRLGQHADVKVDSTGGKSAGLRTVASSAAREQNQRSSAPRLRLIAIAASLALAGLLGASAARWMGLTADGDLAIASPNRIVFDTMRGGDSAPLIDSTGDASGPLLLDIAVPAQATDVVANFADHSTLALPVSADGFVSLTGARATLLKSSPIRIAWKVDGQAQERVIDLAATLANQKAGTSKR